MKKINKVSMWFGALAFLTGWYIPILGIVNAVSGVLVSEDCDKCLAMNILGALVSVLFWIFVWMPMYLPG